MGVSLKSGDKGIGILVLMIFIGLLIGSLLGEFLAVKFSELAFLQNSYQIGLPTPVTLDLKVFILTIGFKFNVNILSIIGVVLAITLYRKY